MPLHNLKDNGELFFNILVAERGLVVKEHPLCLNGFSALWQGFQLYCCHILLLEALSCETAAWHSCILTLWEKYIYKTKSL